MTRKTLIINGFPYVFGNHKPSWVTAPLADNIGVTPTRTQTERSIDPLGGIMTWADCRFSLIDTDNTYDSGGRRLSRLFNFFNNNINYITSPNPLYYHNSAETVTFSKAYHMNKKSIAFDSVDGNRLSVNSSKFNSLTTDFTISLYYYHTLNATGILVYREDHFFIGVTSNSIGASIWNGVAWDGGVSSDTMSADTWYLITVVFSNPNTTIYTNTSSDTVATPTPAAVDYIPIYIGGSDTTPPTCPVDPIQIADFRLWNRALSPTEINIEGIRISNDNIILDYDLAPYMGRVIFDKSGNGIHAKAADEDDLQWIQRRYLRGERIYLPQGTAVINALSAISDYDYQITQQQDDCLESGFCSYYQKIPPNEQITEFTDDYPLHLIHRPVAYYEGSILKYLGKIKDIQQVGKQWDISTTPITAPLTTGIKTAALTSMQPTDWHIEPLSFGISAMFGSSIITADLIDENISTTESGDYSYDDFINILSSTCTSINEVSFSGNNGWLLTASDIIFYAKITNKGASVGNRVARGFLNFDISQETFDMLEYPGDETVRVTWITPLKRYGCILIIGGQLDIGLVGLSSDVVQSCQLLIKTGSEENIIRASINNYNSITGIITIGGLYDKDDNQVPTGLCIQSDNPIVYELVPVISTTYLSDIIYQILCSTGSGTNGVYDKLPGNFGLGIPEEIVDTSTAITLGSTLQWRPADGKSLVADLQSWGWCLIYDSGLFQLKQIQPPELSQSVAVITDADVSPGELNNLNWGYHLPLSSISYVINESKISANSITSSIWDAAEMRTKDLSSSLHWHTMIEAADWIGYQIPRLSWFSKYAPTIQCTIINHSLKLGDVVTVKSHTLAGLGRYGLTQPGLVIEIADDFQVKIILNIDTTSKGVPWVQSLDIESYTGDTLIVKPPEALDFLDLYGIDREYQIIDAAGTVLEASVVISSVTDASTVVLTAAPSYSASTYRGILTLKAYTDPAVENLKTKYVWAADTSGVMSNTDEGKILI